MHHNTENEFDIVYITDNNYFLPTRASVKSAIKNSEGKKLNIFIIGVDIDKDIVDYFNILKKDNINIKVLEYSNEFNDVEIDHIYLSKAALYKFKLADIFKDLDRILYLDGDILLNQGYLSIFNYDVSNYYMGAVVDMQAEKLLDRATFIGNNKYYNSGVMLLNLKKMRQDNCYEKLLEYHINNEERFMDQDAINKVMGVNVLEMNLGYNYMNSNTYFFTNEEMATFYNLNVDEIDAIVDNPYVLHMTGERKAWNDLYSYKGNRWLELTDEEDTLSAIACFFKSGGIKYKLDSLEISIKDSKNNIEEQLNKASNELNDCKTSLLQLYSQTENQHREIDNLNRHVLSLTETLSHLQNRTLYGVIKRVLNKLKGK